MNKIILISLLIVVGLAIIGGFFVYLYNGYWNLNDTDLANLSDQNQQQIVGGDKDEHGCIGSAGYTWCEVKNKCLRVWEEPCEADQTVNWKTYTNTQYGYTIKYPTNGWSIIIEDPYENKLHAIQISAIAEPYDMAGDVALSIQGGNINSWLENKATHTRETVYINGLRAEKFYFGLNPETDTSRTYVFEKNNLVYVINTAVSIGNKYGVSENDISQILSTFKFTK